MWLAGAVAITLFASTLLVSRTQAATLTQNLSLGSSGPEVVDLQAFLSADTSIYPEGLVTGYFGALTRAAVIRYQAANGISQVGIVGPITRASINASSGGVVTGSADVYAPIISNDTVTAGRDNATISWGTNEAATGRVYYGTVWPFLYASALQASNGSYIQNHSIALTGLAPNTTYFYTKESVDSNGNVQWTTHKSLKTAQ